VYSLKSRFQQLLRPTVRMLASMGVTPNQVTIATFVSSLVLGVVVSWRIADRRWLLLLPPFFLVRMALNAMDGMLAREFGQTSNLGAYLNELTDVASDALLYLPFAYLPEFNPLAVGAIIVLSGVSELAGVVATTTGASRRFDGPMGKSDRALAFGAAAAWLGIGGDFAPRAAMVFEAAMVSLLFLTIVNRARKGLAEVESAHRQGPSPKL
jgi:CDP-diacylglycerol---glycerol-3-phosphate 3-phosphatidyltransferase